MEKGTIFQVKIDNKTIEAVVLSSFSTGENGLGDIFVTHICYGKHSLFYYHERHCHNIVQIGEEEWEEQSWIADSNMGEIIASKAYLPDIETALEELS